MIWVAKEDPDNEKLFEFLVMVEEDVIVNGEGAHLGIPGSDAEKRTSDGRDRHRQHLLDEGHAQSSVDHHEETSFSTPPGLDEVTFGIAHPSSSVGDLWPYVNEFPVSKAETGRPSPTPSTLLFQHVPLPFDLPSVHTLQEAFNGVR